MGTKRTSHGIAIDTVERENTLYRTQIKPGVGTSYAPNAIPATTQHVVVTRAA
jgi:hypothetical protein